MMALVLVGVAMACAKLWFDVGALRRRVIALETGSAAFGYPDAAFFRSATEAVEPVVEMVPEPAPTVPAAAEPRVDAIVESQVDPEPSPPEPFIAPTASTENPAGFEDLFGRKLPIWAGGITLAVAGFLIVKYSIDAGLVSPIVRVILGLVFGSALIVAAEAALRGEDRVRDPRVRQALSGAGIATLYASILAAANLYHLVDPWMAFVGMAVTTALAGALSIRFGAPSALLGLVGGLAAPALVGSGTPDVPLLAAYLALTVGGLCAVSRTQRWMWLGVTALTGGFGWGVLLMLGGALDLAATLSIGAYAMLLGLALPFVAFRGARGANMRLLGSLVACAQLAGLVAIGGFGALEWGVFGLVSIALARLSRREVALAGLPAAALVVALLLIAIWPTPATQMLTLVLIGIAAIHGGPAAIRVWRSDARMSDAIILAVIAFAAVLAPATKLDPGTMAVSALALLGASVTAIVAALGWAKPDRSDDPRFAILVATAATLLATAATVVAPTWLIAPAIAVVAIALVLLAERADDPRIDWTAAAFAAATMLVTIALSGDDPNRALGVGRLGLDPRAAVTWIVPAAMAAVFAWRGRLSETAAVAQPVAALFVYVAAAQCVPPVVLPLIPLVMVATLACARALMPAMLAATALAAGWVAMPLATWLAAGGGAVLARPMMVDALPDRIDTLLRLALPAIAAALVAWRRPDLRAAALVVGGVLAGVSLHIGFKQILAIGDLDAFVRLGMAERTVWEMLLAVLAVALRTRAPVIGRALAAASVAHFAWFTLLLHNPLWSLQAVGQWPVANALLPAFGTAFALTGLAGTLTLPPRAVRAREWLRMTLVVVFAAATLRQAFHGSILSVGPVGAGEGIAQSVLLIALGIGFLRHGIAASARDWRIASLVLMLAAVAKVFLIDAAGLDGLLRIASFAALGFSLIGIGWVYTRYLPDDATLTSDSEISATALQGE